MDGKGDSSAGRGLDGLTTEELRISRLGFWDDAFTEMLLRRIPATAARLVDVGCGLATAAHALLPRLPSAQYLGLDADEERLRAAARLLEGTAYRARAELRLGPAERIPLADAQADCVLTSMTLLHLPDVAPALREARRILVPGGRFVGIEPDNLNNLFYFDGYLDEVTAALGELFAAQRRARRPADSAIGPTVASLAEREGLCVVECFGHLLGPVKRQTAKQFLDRVRQVAGVVAARVPDVGDAVAAAAPAIDRAEAEIGAETAGYACQLVPVFVCVAEKR